MTNVLMHDSRRLVLPLDTMVDVLIEFDRAHKRWPERATPENARLVPSGVVVSVRQSGQDAATERSYSLSIIAAAIIHYCAKMRVPVPKNASKSVTVTSDGITMILEGTLLLQRQHHELPAGSVSRPQATEPLAENPTPAASDSSPAQQPDVVPAGLDATTEGKEVEHNAVS